MKGLRAFWGSFKSTAKRSRAW